MGGVEVPVAVVVIVRPGNPSSPTVLDSLEHTAWRSCEIPDCLPGHRVPADTGLLGGVRKPRPGQDRDVVGETRALPIVHREADYKLAQHIRREAGACRGLARQDRLASLRLCQHAPGVGQLVAVLVAAAGAIKLHGVPAKSGRRRTRIGHRRLVGGTSTRNHGQHHHYRQHRKISHGVPPRGALASLRPRNSCVSESWTFDDGMGKRSAVLVNSRVNGHLSLWTLPGKLAFLGMDCKACQAGILSWRNW